MTRINVYADVDEYGADTGEIAGWFDNDKAEIFRSGTRWDGNNEISVMTGSQWVDECLYRTKGGRWVLNHDEHRYRGGPDIYYFITDEQAKDWLLRSEDNDEAVKRFFGEIEEEKGPGRPGIGESINFRPGGELLAMVNEYAERRGITRAEALRRLVTDAVTRARAADAGPLSPQANH